MSTLAEINKETMESMEQCAKDLATARAQLATDLAEANDGLRELMAKWSDRLKAGAARVTQLEGQLSDCVYDCPDLFTKPQSVEIDGVRFGWRKGKGRLEFADEAKLIQKIEDKLTRGQRDAVLKVKKSVLKGPLAKLSAEILKKLGVNVKAAGNEPFVSYPKSNIDKLVAWWLKPQSADSETEEA